MEGLAHSLYYALATKEISLMLIQAVRKRVAVSELPLQLTLAVGTVASFGWLLVQDQIHPLFVYFLQLYLTF
jgi:hypothetical protein